MFPDKMVVISEFGLAGPFAPDTAQADRLRVGIMESQLAEFEKHDFVAGALFWCYQDYKSHRNLWPGLTSDWVEMGIVDENRQRLPSYAAWKERTSPARLGVVFSRGPSGPPTGFRATVERRAAGEIPSYELRGYRLEWEARDHDRTLLASGRTALPVIGSPATVEGAWPATSSRELTLTVRVRFARPASWPRSETSAGGTRARAASAPKRRGSGAWPRPSGSTGGASQPSARTRSATSRAARSWPRAFQWSSSLALVEPVGARRPEGL